MRLLLPLLLAIAPLSAAADESALDDEFSKAERLALEHALDEAHRAVATYAKVNLELDKPKPFEDLLEAHSAQVDVLEDLLVSHGEAVPSSRWAGRVRAPATLLDACTAALQTERESARRHAIAREAIAERAIDESFGRWESTIRDDHIPALDKCVEKQTKKADKQAN